MYRKTRMLRRRVTAVLLGVVTALAWSWGGAAASVPALPAAVPVLAALPAAVPVLAALPAAVPVVIGPPGAGPDFFQCATEGGNCLGATHRYVAYGANGHFVFASPVEDVSPCTNGWFGVDPAPGFVKACYFADYTQIASENGRPFSFGSPREVAYGANGVFAFRTVVGSVACNNATFGDPVPGVAKACFEAHQTYAFGAVEGGVLTGLETTPIAYGAVGHFVYTTASGTVNCTNEAFGADPAPGVSKLCYRLTVPHLADEGGSFNIPGAQFVSVIYGSGANGAFMEGNDASGPCTNAAFGGDPDPGFVKHCYGLPIPG